MRSVLVRLRTHAHETRGSLEPKAPVFGLKRKLYVLFTPFFHLATTR